MKHFGSIFSSILLAFLFIACSSEDDSPAANEDVIIGEWQLRQVEENGVEVSLDACEDLDAFIFEADFSFRAEAYEQVTGEQDCVIANFSEGVWGKNSNNTYFTNTNGVNFPFVAEFSDDQAQMTIVIENLDAGISERRTYERQEDTEG